MSKTTENGPNWAADWIAQQRKKIEEGTTVPVGRDPSEGFGAFFQNLTQGGSGLPPGFAAQASAGQGSGPPLGLMREHEQAWRDLGEAQARYRHAEGELLKQLNAVQLEALTLLEQRVADAPIKEMRHLYDSWVACGEEVYAQRVRTDAFCKTQAEYANAASDLRLKQQVIVERALRMFDLPTRSEINSVHRQLRELKEQLHALATVDATIESTTQTARAKTSSGKRSQGKSTRAQKTMSKRSGRQKSARRTSK